MFTLNLKFRNDIGLGADPCKAILKVNVTAYLT